MRNGCSFLTQKLVSESDPRLRWLGCCESDTAFTTCSGQVTQGNCVQPGTGSLGDSRPEPSDFST